MPVIYYPWGLQAAAIRFKNSLQENAKMHAIAEDVIEACHNGVVAWEKQSNFKPILLRGQDDYIKTKERWEILKDFFEKKANRLQGDLFGERKHSVEADQSHLSAGFCHDLPCCNARHRPNPRRRNRLYQVQNRRLVLVSLRLALF